MLFWLGGYTRRAKVSLDQVDKLQIHALTRNGRCPSHTPLPRKRMCGWIDGWMEGWIYSMKPVGTIEKMVVAGQAPWIVSRTSAEALAVQQKQRWVFQGHATSRGVGKECRHTSGARSMYCRRRGRLGMSDGKRLRSSSIDRGEPGRCLGAKCADRVQNAVRAREKTPPSLIRTSRAA